MNILNLRQAIGGGLVGGIVCGAFAALQGTRARTQNIFLAAAAGFVVGFGINLFFGPRNMTLVGSRPTEPIQSAPPINHAPPTQAQVETALERHFGLAKRTPSEQKYIFSSLRIELGQFAEKDQTYLKPHLSPTLDYIDAELIKLQKVKTPIIKNLNSDLNYLLLDYINRFTQIFALLQDHKAYQIMVLRGSERSQADFARTSTQINEFFSGFSR